MKVLVCGSRKLAGYDAVHTVLANLLEDRGFEVFTVIHGAAQGADTLAGIADHNLGLEVVSVPAEWEKYGKKAGPIRNQKMLDMKPGLVLAFPLPDSVGTFDMVNRARKAGVEVRVYQGGER